MLTAIVNDPAIKAFRGRRRRGLTAEGHACVDRTLLDGRAVATTVTLQSGDTAWCWKIAYSEGVAAFRPVCSWSVNSPSNNSAPACAAADLPTIERHPVASRPG